MILSRPSFAPAVLVSVVMAGAVLTGPASWAAAQVEPADAPTSDTAVTEAPETDAADAAVVFGPALGSKPAASALLDQTGTARSLSELMGTNGIAVYFVRAADWCPVCQAQMIDINARISEFEDRGYAVAVVTTDKPEELTEFAAKRDIAYTLLADTDSGLTRAWGLIDPANPGPRSYGFIRHNGLPYPATIVLNTMGEVTDRLLAEDLVGESGAYRTRVSVDEVLAALDPGDAAP